MPDKFLSESSKHLPQSHNHLINCQLSSVQLFGQTDQKTFSVVLDMEEGTLSFCVEGQFLGVAHRGLRGKKVIHEKYGNDDNSNDDNYIDDGRQTRTILHQGSIKVKALEFVVPFAIFLLQVYPIVSAVWGHCEITMKYLGEF